MLAMSIPVGVGTDATRVSSYNPSVSLYWLVTGKTIGGTALYPAHHRLDRMEALRLYTVGSSWFSIEDGQKGAIFPAQWADLAVLSADYFAIADEQIKRLESLLTIVGAGWYTVPERSRVSPRRHWPSALTSRRWPPTAAIPSRLLGPSHPRGACMSMRDKGGRTEREGARGGGQC
jgi:hypothetical protein